METIKNHQKIILDLCGGTGAWSKPYKDAGYDVRLITLPQYDVTTYEPPNSVYGVLCAPPCTMFSLARTTAKTPRDFDTALIPVRACLEIIWKTQPKFWAIENPRGLLRKFLGRPRYTFDASQFGENYNKHTDIWGYFNEPKLGQYIRYSSTDKNTRKLPPIPKSYIIDKNMTRIAIRRSITPETFANKFFLSNP